MAVDRRGTVLTAPGRALVTADSFSQSVGTRMELRAQATRTRNDLIRGGMAADDAPLTGGEGGDDSFTGDDGHGRN